VHEPELLDEVVKVFVASVDVGLGADFAQSVEVMHVNVDEDAIQASQNLFANRAEILGKRHVVLHRKYRLVVNLSLDPIHQIRHVLVSGKFCGFFVFFSVLPEVFELGTSGHGRAGDVGALFTDGAVDQVDPVEEVDDVDGQPVVEVLARRKLDHLPQIDAGIERGLSRLVQRVALSARRKLLLGPKSLAAVEKRTEIRCKLHQEISVLCASIIHLNLGF